MRSGSKIVANCASCHGIHNIRRSTDPLSTINAKNLPQTCGACHPGAGQHFAIGPVHSGSLTSTEHASVKWIRIAYWLIIPMTIGFMLLHNGLDFFSKLIRHRAHPAGPEHERMNLQFRIAHWMVQISFPALVITGFALKFPESWWASLVPYRGTLHRAAAILLCISVAYHIGHLLIVRRDRIVLRLLLPAWQDLRDLFDLIRYHLGLIPERPQFGAFSYAEKMEYWAFMWGTIVMAVSGFLLWFNNLTLRWFPKWITDAATALPYYEAILATAAIVVWHFYMVIFDPDVYPMDRAWITGKTSAHPRKAEEPKVEELEKKA